MNPLTGIIDSYDVHVPWRNGAINLWGMGCPESATADTGLPGVSNSRHRLVQPIHRLAQSLFDFVAESL